MLILIFVSFILMLILLLQGAKAPLVVHEFILFSKRFKTTVVEAKRVRYSRSLNQGFEKNNNNMLVCLCPCALTALKISLRVWIIL